MEEAAAELRKRKYYNRVGAQLVVWNSQIQTEISKWFEISFGFGSFLVCLFGSYFLKLPNSFFSFSFLFFVKPEKCWYNHYSILKYIQDTHIYNKEQWAINCVFQIITHFTSKGDLNGSWLPPCHVLNWFLAITYMCRYIFICTNRIPTAHICGVKRERLCAV